MMVYLIFKAQKHWKACWAATSWIFSTSFSIIHFNATSKQFGKEFFFFFFLAGPC
jgi:hypothetical protein